MTLPALPALNSTSWYPWASGLDSLVRSDTRAPAPTGNDRAALQALIDALGSAGGTVTLRPGTYTVSGGPLLLPSRVTLAGAGRGATTIRQTTTGTPAVASANWANVGSPLGFTAVRDLTITGATGTNAHGLVLRDFYADVTNVEIKNCGGHGLYLTDANQSGTSVSGTLVENRFDRIAIRDCGGWGFLVQSDGAKVTDAWLGDIAVQGNGGTGGINVRAGAGWSIGHVHTYGPFNGPAVKIENPWECWLHSAQIEDGWTGYGLYVTGMQRDLHLGSISVTCNNVASETALRMEKAGAISPGDGVTINTLTVAQDNAQPVIALTWDDPNSPVQVGRINLSGGQRARITPVGGFGASAVSVASDAMILGENRLWETGAAQSVAFTVRVQPWHSAVGTLSIASAQFNNGGLLASYTGQLLLSAKDNATDGWAAHLTPLGTPTGFTAGPAVAVTGTGDTRTVTVTFTPASANGFGASCALILANQ